MSKFAIVTDSCSDLDKELREKYEIDYVRMRYLYDDKDVPASLDWEFLPYKDFYDLMRKGTRIKTAQVPNSEYEEVFTKYLEKGMDVVSISCSTALSASYFASVKVAEDLLKKYPERKIYCIDSLCSCIGLGMICMWASLLRAEGKTAEQVRDLVEEHKLEANQFATVEDLTYLKRAGRVKAASAFFGGLLQVKPIIISDAQGQNFAVEKVKGRKNSIAKIVDMMIETYNKDFEYKEIFVSHADDLATAEEIKAAIKEKMGNGVSVSIAKIGPIVGASVGPGTVATYCFGKKVTVNQKA